MNIAKEIKKENKESNSFKVMLKWLIQILLWINITLLIIFRDSLFSFENENKNGLILEAFFLILYTIYNLISFKYSITWKYLRNKKNSIDQALKPLLTSQPKISFVGNSFKTEKKRKKKKKSKNKNKNKNKNTIEVDDSLRISQNIINNKNDPDFRKFIFSEEIGFEYYSARDISDDFIINTGSKKTFFIKLNLLLSVTFDESISILDYENAKTEFWLRNKTERTEFVITEKVTLDNLDKIECNLLTTSNYQPPFINCFFYVFFTVLIPIIQIYKLYFNFFCIEQSFTIKKVISTRYDLNSNQEERKTSNFISNLRSTRKLQSIVINSQVIVLELDQPRLTTLLPESPTDEELNEAKKKYDNSNKVLKTSLIFASNEKINKDNNVIVNVMGNNVNMNDRVGSGSGSGITIGRSNNGNIFNSNSQHTEEGSSNDCLPVIKEEEEKVYNEQNNSKMYDSIHIKPNNDIKDIDTSTDVKDNKDINPNEESNNNNDNFYNTDNIYNKSNRSNIVNDKDNLKNENINEANNEKEIKINKDSNDIKVNKDNKANKQIKESKESKINNNNKYKTALLDDKDTLISPLLTKVYDDDNNNENKI